MHPRLFVLSLLLCVSVLGQQPPATIKGIYTGGLVEGMLECDNLLPGQGETTDPIVIVELAEPLDAPVTIRIETSVGTATPGVDYIPLSEELAFPTGATMANTRLYIKCDHLDEDNETIILTAMQDGQVRATRVATIVDNDWTPDGSVSDESLMESDTESSTIRFMIRLSEKNKVPIDIDYTTVDGTAVAGSDYVAQSGTLRIWNGDSAGYLFIPVLGDTSVEPDETFSLQLSNPRNVHLERTSATATIITDDFPPPPFTINPTSRVEGDDGPKEIELVVELGTAHASPVMVTVLPTGDGSATQNVDYEMAAQTLTFAAGETELTAKATILGDTIAETDEAFEVALLEDGVVRTTALIRIRDDDDEDLPLISIGDIQITETDATTQAIFPVTLSKAAGGVVRVSYETFAESTTMSVDHANATGEIMFLSGETSRTVTVDVVGDLEREVTETFRVDLSDAEGAKIGDASGTCTIVDDDTQRRRAARH